MKSSLLVTGSIAFDRIAVFKDKFANHILRGHVHNLNVSFMVEDMAVNYGGTGSNIAYNLSLLGEKPLLMGAIGQDGGDYMEVLKKSGVNTKAVKKFPKLMTASATIMTDLDDNQITAFHMGAMKEAGKLKMSQIKDKVSLAIIAPNDIKAMQDYGDYCFNKDIPFIADPGQGIPAFSKVELQEFIMGAHVLIANDYEWEMISKKTGWNLKTMLENVNFLIITFGEKGSKILCRDDTVINVPAYKSKAVVDPTGCGDAYRAGLMYGYQHGYDIEASAHIGAWLASKAVERKGTQNHKIKKVDFKNFLKRL